MKKVMGYCNSNTTRRGRNLLFIAMIIASGIILVILNINDLPSDFLQHNITISDAKPLFNTENSSGFMKGNKSKIYYVDRDVKKAGDGTSWTNAATKLSSLSWENISAGDTIYISGGSDSLVYSPDQIANKAISGNSYVVITKGKDAGHNGEVIYAAVASAGWGLFINTCNNIKITGLKFECLIDTAGGYGNTWPSYNIQVIT